MTRRMQIVNGKLVITGLLSALVLALSGVLAAAPATAQATPLGVWLATSDTGNKGHIRIYKCGAKLCGKLIWSSKPNALDSNNPDKSKRSRKVVGTDIVWGFVPDGKDQWDGGRIYDPGTGKVYKSIMRLKNGGKILHVRGYVGISLIGKTRVWTRVE